MNHIEAVDRNTQTSDIEVTFNHIVTTSIPPNVLAEMFWLMDDNQQAEFLNALADIAGYHIIFQLQSITDNPNLSLEARVMMEQFGDYARNN